MFIQVRGKEAKEARIPQHGEGEDKGWEWRENIILKHGRGKGTQ